MRVIVIGAGYFGINYVRELAGNLTAVIEPDEQRAKFVVDHYNIPVYSHIPPDLKYDASVVVTPPNTHIDIALSEAMKGKLVLIEKPMATSVFELLKLRNYSRQIMSGLIYLYNPAFLQFAERVSNLSEICHIFTRRTNDGPVRSWQDSSWDLAAHDIAMLNYMFGTPDSVTKLGDRDYSLLKLGYHQIQALIYVSWRGGPKIRCMEVAPFEGDRLMFDDMAVVHDISPLRLMLDDFLTGQWDDKASFNAGLEVVNVLETADRN